MSDARDLGQLLAAPFEPDEVKYKPAMVKGNRALALAYIDARLVAERLDEVVGTGGWKDRYKVLDKGCVVCTLALLIEGTWVEKSDVGCESEQPDSGDRMKAAFSDAMKRAAVKFGIGRYLYRLPQQWVDYDPAKKQITKLPVLPVWARPSPESAARAAEKPPYQDDAATGAVETTPVTRVGELQEEISLVQRGLKAWAEKSIGTVGELGRMINGTALALGPHGEAYRKQVVNACGAVANNDQNASAAVGSVSESRRYSLWYLNRRFGELQEMLRKLGATNGQGS